MIIYILFYMLLRLVDYAVNEILAKIDSFLRQVCNLRPGTGI